MRAIGRTSKLWVWGAVAALTVGMVGFGEAANAAPPASSSAPAATASAAEPVDDTVLLTYSVNRAVKHGNPSVSCTLDGGPLFDCGTASPPTKKLTSYTLNLSGQSDGPHVFTVTFMLTDGGTATASVRFSIDTVQTLEEACAELGGAVTYNPDIFFAWMCLERNPDLGTQPGTEDVFNALVLSWAAALDSYCPTSLATHWDVDGGVLTEVAVFCRRA